MDVSVTLTVEDQSFNVLQCKYGFRRKTNSKGYPLGGVLGGEIFITFEDEGENGIKRADYPGVADSNGIVVIEDFKLELVEKEEGND